MQPPSSYWTAPCSSRNEVGQRDPIRRGTGVNQHGARCDREVAVGRTCNGSVARPPKVPYRTRRPARRTRERASLRGMRCAPLAIRFWPLASAGRAGNLSVANFLFSRIVNRSKAAQPSTSGARRMMVWRRTEDDRADGLRTRTPLHQLRSRWARNASVTSDFQCPSSASSVQDRVDLDSRTEPVEVSPSQPASNLLLELTVCIFNASL